MKKLVSPTRVVHYIDEDRTRGEQQLKVLQSLYKLDVVDMGNLRQLLGWVGVGAHRSTPRKKTGEWQLLEGVRWLQHTKSKEPVLLLLALPPVSCQHH